jgi:hypothetical protein
MDKRLLFCSKHANSPERDNDGNYALFFKWILIKRYDQCWTGSTPKPAGCWLSSSSDSKAA